MLLMKINLSCRALGMKAPQLEALELAHRHGFDAVEAAMQAMKKALAIIAKA